MLNDCCVCGKCNADGQQGDSAQCVGDAALMPFDAIGNEINSIKW